MNWTERKKRRAFPRCSFSSIRFPVCSELRAGRAASADGFILVTAAIFGGSSVRHSAAKN
jgi:hypothetical protein